MGQTCRTVVRSPKSLDDEAEDAIPTKMNGWHSHNSLIHPGAFARASKSPKSARLSHAAVIYFQRYE